VLVLRQALAQVWQSMAAARLSWLGGLSDVPWYPARGYRCARVAPALEAMMIGTLSTRCCSLRPASLTSNSIFVEHRCASY